MLDLKGHDRRLADRVAAALEWARPGARVTVCSQDWGLLEPLDGAPGIRVVHSVGSARGLARLRTRFDGRRLAGVSIHRKLLDAETARDLRARAELLMSWPVETVPVARTLAGLGVQGLISQTFEPIVAALAVPEPLAA